MISLAQQIDEVRRELHERERVYARMYAKGTLRPSLGEFQVERMKAVLKTLLWLKENEEKIKTALSEGREDESDTD